MAAPFRIASTAVRAQTVFDLMDRQAGRLRLPGRAARLWGDTTRETR